MIKFQKIEKKCYFYQKTSKESKVGMTKPLCSASGVLKWRIVSNVSRIANSTRTLISNIASHINQNVILKPKKTLNIYMFKIFTDDEYSILESFNVV